MTDRRVEKAKMKKFWQVAMVGGVVVYVTMRILSLCGIPGEAGNGFEFSVAKHRDESQKAEWSVKMSAGTLDLNLKWNP